MQTVSFQGSLAKAPFAARTTSGQRFAGQKPATFTAPVGDTVRFGQDATQKPGISERLLYGLKQGLSPKKILADTIWIAGFSAVFAALSATATLLPSLLATPPLIGTLAILRAVSGFMSGPPPKTR